MRTNSLLAGIVLVIGYANCLMAAGLPSTKLSGASNDNTYGLTETNPVKVGGFNKSGSKNVYQYISLLTGPHGEEVFFQRKGSCCPFETKNTPYPEASSTGLLDIFLIKYEGIQAPVKLYINSYDFEMPRAPAGFKLKENTSRK